MWFINHPNCNRNMGAPQGLESEVETLRIADRTDRFGRAMTSYWLPNAADLEVLNAGGSVALTIHSQVHPILSMSVEKKP